MIGAFGDQPVAYKKLVPDAGRCGDAVGQQAKTPVTAAREGVAEKCAGPFGLWGCAWSRSSRIFVAPVTSVAPSDAGLGVGTARAGTGDVPV